MSKLTVYKHNQWSLEREVEVPNLESIFWKESAYEDGEFILKTRDTFNINHLRSGSYVTCDCEGTPRDRLHLMVVTSVNVKRDSLGQVDIEIKGKNASIMWKYQPCLPNIESINKEINVWDDKTPKGAMYLTLLRGHEYAAKSFVNFDYDNINSNSNEILADDNRIERIDIGRRTVYDVCREISQAYLISFYGVIRSVSDPRFAMVYFYPIDTGNAVTFDYKAGDILSENYTHDNSNMYHEVRVFTPDASDHYSDDGEYGDYFYRLGFADHEDFEDERRKVEAQQQANLEAVKRQRELAESEGRDYTPAELADIYLRALQNGLENVGYYYEQKAQAHAKAKELLRARQTDKFYSFEISPDARRKYRKDYDLGHVVTVKTSWGDAIEMLVSSFVRYEEYGMYKEYPELIEYKR